MILRTKPSLLALFAVVCLSFATFSLGCGSSDALVGGSVTFDGQPVESGTILFEPNDGVGNVAGGTIQNGKYYLGSDEKLTPGSKVVRIKATRATGKKIKAGPPAADDVMVDEIQQYIPPRYNDSSTLIAVIAGGKSTQNFELTSQP